MSALAISGAIELASRVASSMASGNNSLMPNASLIDVSSVARVEPITMLDADCVNIPEISDITKSVETLFSGYYLQAVNIMNTIGDVSVASKLGPLNPNRKLGLEALQDEALCALSMENYEFRLPSSKVHPALALEALPSGSAKPPKTGGSEFKIDDKVLDKVNESANLSIGKIYNVQLKHNGQSITIPIAIRLMVNVIPSRMMVDLFTYRNNFDLDMKERFHDWRSGRLSFVGDLILCNDLIDKRRKAGIRDRSGIMGQINNRESKNFVAGFINGKGSVATATNLAIISTDTLELVELELNGKLANSKVRAAMFENTNLMILAVVDKGYERVIFYHRGLEATTNVSFRELKSASKGYGSDVSDILKAYISGSSPSL